MLKSKKNSMFNVVADQKGSVIVVAILMLALLSIVGISATDTSTLEQQIANNDQYHKIAFFNADSGIYTTPKLIGKSIRTSEAVPTGTGNPATSSCRV